MGSAESGPGEEGIRPGWDEPKDPRKAESGPGEEGITPGWDELEPLRTAEPGSNKWIIRCRMPP